MNKLNNYLYNTDHHDMNHMIAKFIKKHMGTMNDITIDDIASTCYVSKAKVSKFCKILGYDNFIALKDDCLKESQMKKMVIEKQRENLELDFQSHIHQSMQVIENNLHKVNQETLNQLVDDIAKANYIFLYGVAYGYLLCEYIQIESDFLGKDVIVLDEKLMKDYVMKDNALLILITEGNDIFPQQRILRKLNKYPVKHWLISTDKINKDVLNLFQHTVMIPTENADVKDCRLLIRYIIDVILGRYQYLYV